MKKAIIMMCSLLMVTLLSAQSVPKHSVSVQGGVGIGNAEKANTLFPKSSPTLGGHARVLYGFHFNKHFSLHSGVGYFNNTISSTAFYQTIQLHNAEIPVLALVRIPKEKWASYFQVGVAYTYTTGHEYPYFAMPAGEPTVQLSPFREYIEHNLIMNLGAGVEYMIKPRIIVFGGVEYKRTVIKTTLHYSDQTPIALWSASLNLGCRFHLGK